MEPGAPQSTLTTADRWVAAGSHLGVPFCALFLPLIIWGTSPIGSFRRLHARQAFSYQLIYFPVHVALTVVMAFGAVKPLLVCMLLGFALEIPQMVCAALGRRPLPLPPFKVLNA
ncbi:MAG: hypothetical protein AB7V43_22880 [Acidimicrobiia bacterium]